jgi:predicted RNase H-like HicB family nuclease
MKTDKFKVVLEPDEDAGGNPAWHAYCPALEPVGGATSGRTREEALRNINEVMRMVARELVEEGGDRRMWSSGRAKNFLSISAPR